MTSIASPNCHLSTDTRYTVLRPFLILSGDLISRLNVVIKEIGDHWVFEDRYLTSGSGHVTSGVDYAIPKTRTVYRYQNRIQLGYKDVCKPPSLVRTF